MLDKKHLPLLSVTAVDDYFLKVDNTSFDSAFLLFQFYVARLLCSNRVKIVDEKTDINKFPNMYALTFNRSGTGKDRTRNIIEKLIPFYYESLKEMESDFRKNELAKIETKAEKDGLKKAATRKLIESEMPRSLYSTIKSNATPEGLGAVHNALFKARFGAVMWLDKEICDTMARYRSGGPLDDLTTMIKESFDNGDFEPKIIKGEKMVQPVGPVPYLAWLHGAIDEDEGQNLFKKFFNLGFARRIFIHIDDNKYRIEDDLDTIEKKLEEAQKEKASISKFLKQIYDRTLPDTRFENGGNIEYKFTDNSRRLYLKYKNDCNNKAIDMPDTTTNLIKDELANRSWRMISLACVFAAQSSEKPVIRSEHIDQAIYVTDYYGKNMLKFMRSTNGTTLAESLIETIKTEGEVKTTDIYKQHYFPKFKSGQKKILDENIDIANEILAGSGEIIHIIKPDGRQKNYKISKLPEGFEEISKAIKDGDINAVEKQSLIEIYGEKAIKTTIEINQFNN